MTSRIVLFKEAVWNVYKIYFWLGRNGEMKGEQSEGNIRELFQGTTLAELGKTTTRLTQVRPRFEIETARTKTGTVNTASLVPPN
jgi:hypothetical protein